MHLEVAVDGNLRDLDLFLRKTWLECCGHLSEFTIEGVNYVSGGLEYQDDAKSMGVALGRVLRPGAKFSHEYDFGSTTELALRVVSEGEAEGRQVRVLARNDPPTRICQECEATDATLVTTEWPSDDKRYFCDGCADLDEVDEDMGMFLPVVNSPRVGICGYEG
jgi:hypothetical protein